jgi:large subunit ribosomal protein L10
MLTREQKQAQIEVLHEKFARATAILAFDYRGLTVDESNQLRAQLRAAGATNLEYRVVKNTLVKRAVEGTGSVPLAKFCVGPTAVGIAYEDEPATLARVLIEYAKKNEKMKLRGGVFDGAALDARGIEALSKLPSKHELRGMLAGTLQAPLRNLAGTMYSLLGHLRNALEQRQQQLGE